MASAPVGGNAHRPKRLRCDPSAGSSNDHLLNQCFGNHVPDTFGSCVPRPVTPGPGSNRVFDPGFSATRGKGAGGTCVLEHSGFSTSAPQLDPFPPLDLNTGRTRLSLQVSKAISCFARHPDRPPAGLISADDGSLDVHQIWLHWGRWMNCSRQQLLQCITEHAFGSQGRMRFLLRSDEDCGPGSQWPS